MKSPSVRLSLAWLSLWALCSAIAWITTSTDHQLALALSPYHDVFGRNLFLLVPRAALLSMGFAGTAVFLSTVGALIFGSSLALLKEPTRSWGVGALELLLAFPGLLLALAWAAVRGPGWSTLLASLLLGTLPGLARLVQVRAVELASQPFVESAQALGASPPHIGARHFFPHLVSWISVRLPSSFAHALLAEATLSFLGVGVPLGSVSWGSLLAQGRDYLLEAPHIALTAGIPLLLTVMALQNLSLRLARVRT